MAKLVNKYKSAGIYERKWNASGGSTKGGYALGVYFYQLKAGDYTNTKKMMLICSKD